MMKSACDRNESLQIGRIYTMLASIHTKKNKNIFSCFVFNEIAFDLFPNEMLPFEWQFNNNKMNPVVIG